MPKVLPNDPFAPNYVLLVNDSPLENSTMKLISGVTWEDESDQASSLSFSVAYQRNVVGGISTNILDGKIFAPGNKVILKGGYGRDLVVLGGGYITELEPNFSEDSPPELKVVCYDKLHNLSLLKSETGRSWPITWRDSQIVTSVGAEGGFVITKTESASLSGIRKTRSRVGEQPRDQRRGESHFSFLRSVADQNGFELSARYDPKVQKYRLFFEPPKDQTQSMFSFIYGNNATYGIGQSRTGESAGTLLSFQPKFSITSQFTKYKAYSTNANGQSIAHTMTLGDFIDKEDIKLGGVFADAFVSSSQTKSAANVRSNAFGEIIEIVSTKIFGSRKEANEYLKIHMKILARDYISGSAKIKGNQYIQSRQVHTLSGLGPFFDGDYYVKKAVHSFSDDGYSTSMEVRKVTPEEKTR